MQAKSFIAEPTEPTWEPLKKIKAMTRLDMTRADDEFGVQHWERFMYMGTFESGDKKSRMHSYKDDDSRRYIHVCEDGKFWELAETLADEEGNVRWDAGVYVEIREHEALEPLELEKWETS